MDSSRLSNDWIIAIAADENLEKHVDERTRELELSEPVPHGHTRSDHSKKTVMVIEDKAILRSTISMMLDQCGMFCIQVDSGEKGIELFGKEQENIDAVFLDMVMQGMNGTEVLDCLKQISPEIPVILTSGFIRNEDIPSLAQGFLKKPFRMNELMEILDKCFQSGEDQKE